MKREIREYINHYRGLWERQKGYDPVVSEDIKPFLNVCFTLCE